MRILWGGLAAALAACSFTPRGDGDAAVGDPDAPGAIDARDPDAPGAIDAPGPIDGPSCTPDCAGDVLTTCTAPATVTCAAGCGTTGGAHCLTFTPSNTAPTAAALASTVDLIVPAGRFFVFNTDDGAITDYDASEQNGVVVRHGGGGVVDQIDVTNLTQTGTTVGLTVWSFRTLTLSDASSRVGIRGARAAAIVVAGAIRIRGAIDASGGQDLAGAACTECAGPGGGAGGTLTTAAGGCAPGGPGNYSGAAWETGGAGGGMATQGGAGGASTIAGGAPGAIASCSGATLEPLVGGGGGGRGATNSGNGGAVGGGGGGGLQLTSLTSIVVDGASAEVYAGGIGGAGDANQWGGGGGGAGGALLLEAPEVTISNGAVVAANGGGGGAGRAANDGEFGRSDSMRAPGGAGTGVNSDTGRGGWGGVVSEVTMVAGLPSAGYSGGDGTGGGGGAAGRVRLNTRSGRVPMTAGGVVSPQASTGTRPAQ